MSLTDQQTRAVTTREVSVVLSSGAGCGKTHVLTERYLAHLREGAAVGEIVAITFTERAARQMRGRIRAAIGRHIRTAAEADAERWVRHQRDLEQAPISTIHAFCGSLLRQYAVEAGLDPQFEVLEEVLTIDLRSEAVEGCLQRLLLSDSAVAADLRALILLHGWRGVLTAVSDLLHSHDARRWQRWAARPAADIAADWLSYARGELLPRHLDLRLRSRPAVARTLALLRRHPPLPGPMSEPVALVLDETPKLPLETDLEAAVKRLTEAAKVGKVGSKAWPDPAVYEAIKESFEQYRAALRSLGAEGFTADEEELAAAVAVGQRYLRVAAEAMRSYRDLKGQHGRVDFQDLLTRSRDLLRDHPEVRARVQARYRHLLIDELQDTDPVQMELVESLAGGGLTAGKLFAVGDHKQSIYRFRGADVSLFQALRNQMPLAGRQTLSLNFRSQPALLDFTNALMAEALQHYEPLRPHLPQVNRGACIEFLWSPRPDESSVSEARRVEAEWIARRLAGMIGHEALVADEQTGVLRPVRAGDIVLLFRAMSHVHLYESALRRYGLNYYLVGGRAFFAQQEVYDLLHLLRALENPEDALSLAGTLRSPFCCLSDESLFVLTSHRGGLWAALFDEHTFTLLRPEQGERVKRARANLTHWRSLKDQLPIARLIDTVLADSAYDAAVRLEFLGERKLANLWKLTDLARTFDRSGLFGLAEFIARLGDLVAAQPREEQAATQPENADVIRLMTIHQAKGLEFPVVVVPDLAADGGSPFTPVARWDRALGCVVRPPADEDPPPFPDFGGRLLRAAEELEEWHEDLRTLYVACTRPRDYLILSAALPAKYQPAGAWMLTLAERFDLDTGICRDGAIPPEHQPCVRVVAAESALPPAGLPADDAVPPAVAPAEVPEMRPVRGAEIITIDDLQTHLEWAESLFASLDAAAPTPVERLLRGVLQRWDFADPDGWRGLVARLAPRRGLPADGRATVERLLADFAVAPLRQRLARARAVRRGVEFVTRLRDDPLPGVAGRVDCLFQDDRGWWLLEWVTDVVASASRQVVREQRELRLGLAAEALRRQGVEPRGALLALLREGEVIERPAAKLLSPALRERTRQALMALASQPVSA